MSSDSPLHPNDQPAHAESIDVTQTTAIWVGRLSARDCVRAILEMAQSVGAWHLSGRLHRGIQFDALHWPHDADQPLLIEPSAIGVEFGGPFADPDLCPPELRGLRTIVVPCSLSDAQRVLTEQGVIMAPERIDVYQLGTLLGRLVTGKSIRAYLSSPATMSRVPKLIRNVIDRCVGYDESHRVESVEALIELLTATVEERGLSGDVSHASLRDTDVTSAAETRVARRVPPFQRLGHFEVLEEIGHGGMGVVYRGYDRTLDRTVALKVLHPRFARDPSFVKRFKAEAAAAAKLNHPHLVPIYFIGEDVGRHFYAMQFIDGESLAERLVRVGRLARDEVLAIMQQVLLGLAAAHRQGFVHRDIKPGNIILDRANGSALLTDFGLACGPVNDEHADSNFVLGTAEYMSPEQAQGDRVDARSDLYSVGVLLYELSSGKSPFDANTPSSQLIQHVCEQPQPLSLVAPEVEPPLVRIVERLLKKRPAERYQSVDEVLIDMQQLPGQLPLLTPGFPQSRLMETVVPKSRWSIKRLGGIAGVIALLAVMWSIRPQLGEREVTLAPHADPVWALAFSSDGKTLVSGGGRSTSLKEAGDTCLRLWDAGTGRMLKQSERLPIGPERLVMWDDSQRVLAIASAREGTGTTVVWDPQSGKQEAPAFDDPFAFHFDSAVLDRQTLLAVGNRGLTELSWRDSSSSLQRRDVATSKLPFRAIAVARNTKSPQVFVAWDSGVGESMVTQFGGPGLKQQASWRNPSGTIHAMAVTPDGARLVLRSVSQRGEGEVGDSVIGWNVAAGDEAWRQGLYVGASRALSISRDGRRVLTLAAAVRLTRDGVREAPPQSAVVLDVATGKELCRVQSGSSHLQAVAISPDGRTAALGDASGKVVFSRLP